MRDSFGTALVLWFGVGLLFICVLFFLNHTIDAMSALLYCKKHGKEITATIVDNHITRNPTFIGRASFSPVFKFKYDGNTKRKVAFQPFFLFFKIRFSTEKEMQIYYCEAHPDFVIMKGRGQYVLGAIWLLPLSICAFFLFWFLFFYEFRISLLSCAAVAAVWWVRTVWWGRVQKRKSKNG